MKCCIRCTLRTCIIEQMVERGLLFGVKSPNSPVFTLFNINEQTKLSDFQELIQRKFSEEESASHDLAWQLEGDLIGLHDEDDWQQLWLHLCCKKREGETAHPPAMIKVFMGITSGRGYPESLKIAPSLPVSPPPPLFLSFFLCPSISLTVFLSTRK